MFSTAVAFIKLQLLKHLLNIWPSEAIIKLFSFWRYFWPFERFLAPFTIFFFQYFIALEAFLSLDYLFFLFLLIFYDTIDIDFELCLFENWVFSI